MDPQRSSTRRFGVVGSFAFFVVLDFLPPDEAVQLQALNQFAFQRLGKYMLRKQRAAISHQRYSTDSYLFSSVDVMTQKAAFTSLKVEHQQLTSKRKSTSQWRHIHPGKLTMEGIKSEPHILDMFYVNPKVYLVNVNYGNQWRATVMTPPIFCSATGKKKKKWIVREIADATFTQCFKAAGSSRFVLMKMFRRKHHVGNFVKVFDSIRKEVVDEIQIRKAFSQVTILDGRYVYFLSTERQLKVVHFHDLQTGESQQKDIAIELPEAIGGPFHFWQPRARDDLLIFALQPYVVHKFRAEIAPSLKNVSFLRSSSELSTVAEYCSDYKLPSKSTDPNLIMTLLKTNALHPIRRKEFLHLAKLFEDGSTIEFRSSLRFGVFGNNLVILDLEGNSGCSSEGSSLGASSPDVLWKQFRF